MSKKNSAVHLGSVYMERDIMLLCLTNYIAAHMAWLIWEEITSSFFYFAYIQNQKFM